MKAIKKGIIFLKGRKPKASTIISIGLLFVISLLVLGLFVKGDKGDPILYQSPAEKETNVGGPFESSNSTSRYVLTEAIVENHSLLLTESQASFASPDVSYYNGKFLSIFTPGISFIGVPFYLLGKFFGLPQIFAYTSVTLFGIINMFLIARVAYKLGANLYASLLGGFLFLFGTNALPYSLFFTQHATSVTFLLLSLLTAMGKRTVLKTILFGAFVGISFLLDIPNIILLTPIGIYFLSRYFKVSKVGRSTKLSFNMKLFTVLFGIIPFIVFTAWYNFNTTGSYTKIGQTIGQSSYFRGNVPKKEEHKEEKPTQVVPFTPRSQINGLYTLLVSNERAWIFYSPIVVLGVLGIFSLYKDKRKRALANVITGTILMNIVLYSMFDDPWGGWAFGPRYLIPAASMLCIGLGLTIQTYKNHLWFLLLFAVTALYSLIISVLGALTTSAIPPKVEATNLINPLPYTYFYNIQLANDNRISALFYNLFLPQMSGWVYIFSIVGVLFVAIILLYHFAVASERSKEI